MNLLNVKDEHMQPVLFYRKLIDGRWIVINALSQVPSHMMPASTLEMNNSANYTSYNAAQTLRRLKSRKPQQRIDKLKKELDHLNMFDKQKKNSPKRITNNSKQMDFKGNF